MLQNYLKTAWRMAFRNKGNNLLASLGLAVGIGCFLLVSLFILYEFSYESHHEKADRVYRVGKTIDLRGEQRKGTQTASLVGPTATEEIPEVQQFVHLEHMGESLVRAGNEVHYENSAYFTDGRIFDVFSIPLLTGNSEKALAEPMSVVISSVMAKKYFGKENPLGKTLTIRENLNLTITAVIENPPSATNLPFHFLAYIGERSRLNWNPLTAITTYLQLEEGVDSEIIEHKLLEMRLAQGEDLEMAGYEHINYELDRLDRMHLFASVNPTGDFRYVYIFGVVALFLLVIAVINYINLSIAQLIPRSREVGIRKAMGASRSQLTHQYLTETIIISIIAITLGVMLAMLLRPLIDDLPGIELAQLLFDDIRVWTILVSLTLMIPLFSGSYIIFYLARLNPATIFQHNGRLSPGSTRLRKGLITFQFTISLILICCTIIAHYQLQYIRDVRLGFEKDHMLILNLDEETREQYQVLQQKIESLAGVRSASATSGIPGDGGFITLLLGEEYKISRLAKITIDTTFPYQMGMSWVRQPIRTLKKGDWILNRSAAEVLGVEKLNGLQMSDIIGADEDQAAFQGELTGIVENFNFRSLHHEVEPLAMEVGSEGFRKLAIRLQPGSTGEVLGQIRDDWNEFAPGKPLDFAFLDDRIGTMYQNEMRFAQIFQGFSLVTIIIACLGLYSLAAYSTERREKEIGVRKVLGASTIHIVALINKDFLKLVFLGFILAIPIAYISMTQWLSNFAYRIETDIEIFLLAGLVAVMLALITVSRHSIRAAKVNPAETLRSE